MTAGPPVFSGVRFTDLISDSLRIPAINRWAIFNRPLVRTRKSLLIYAKQPLVN